MWYSSRTKLFLSVLQMGLWVEPLCGQAACVSALEFLVLTNVLFLGKENLSEMWVTMTLTKFLRPLPNSARW